MLLRARQFEFRFPRPALVAGILNITPDSFSDGGLLLDPGRAIERGLELEALGADLLDIGGESTRPHSTPVPEDEELRRVLPVIEGLAGRVKIPLSIDTMKAGVAQAAIARGVAIINDVATNLEDRRMAALAAETGAAYICMHMRGTPQTMHAEAEYRDVVKEVAEFLKAQMVRLQRCGVMPEQIILDPGIGFGKTAEHNLELLGNLNVFARLGRPLMLGVSRKSFIGKIAAAEADRRVPGGLACACLGVQAGVCLIRTHDVAETVQALRVAEAILARRRLDAAKPT